MKKIIILSIIISLGLSSCKDDQVEAVIRVQNKVHNVKLERVYWNNFQLAYSLLPGQTSNDYVIYDYPEDFPKTDVAEFYMTADGNRVYLQTRQSYTLNAEQDLTIIIDDTTRVFNPLTEE